MFSPAVARSVVALSSLAALAGCQAGEVAVDQPRMSEDEPREEKVDRDQDRDRDRDERDERRGDDDAPRMDQPGDSTVMVHFFLPISVICPAHSPSAPLNNASDAPLPSRIT